MAGAIPSPNASWRDSARPARLWIFDYRTSFPLLLFLFHITTWTFVLAIGVMGFFSIIAHFGFTISVFGRAVRSWFAGRRKMATPWWM